MIILRLVSLLCLLAGSGDCQTDAGETSGYCVNTTLPAWVEPDAEIVVSMGDGGSAMEALAATGVLTLTRSFHVCGLPSGDYTLMVSLQSASGTPEWFGLESVTVDKKSLTLGEISLQQPVAETVMATINDKLPTALPASLGLSLEPVRRLPFAGETVRPDVDSSGQITFPRLFRGEYWVNSDGPTSPLYVADISAGSRDGSHRPIVIGEGPLALRLKSNGASLSGTVTTEDASGSLPDRGVVLAFHTEKGLVRLSQLDQENKFSFQGLPPGGYKIMALFGIERDSLESPLVFQRWLSQAQEVSLSPYAARDIEIHPVVVRQ